MTRLAVFSVGFLTFVSAAWAQPNPIVARAMQSYRDGDYATAVTLLERTLASGLDESDARRDARLYLAAAAFAMGASDRATAALTQLFEAFPDVVVDSSAFPPPFLALVERTRASVKPTAPRPIEPAVTPPVLTPPVAITEPAAPNGKRWWALAPAGAAIAAGVTSGFFLSQASQRHLALTGPLQGPTDVLDTMRAEQLAQEGRTAQSLGFVMIGVAAAALGTAVLLWILGGSS